MHNVVKWPNILQKSCGVNTARFLKYVWPFFNIMHERVNLRFKCFHSKFESMNVNIQISRFETSKYLVKCFFLIMGSLDGEGLSKLYLELLDAYQKRIMPQN